MLLLLGGFAILCGFLLLGYLFVNADPAKLARLARIEYGEADQLEVVVVVGGEGPRLGQRDGDIGAGKRLGGGAIADALERDQHAAVQFLRARDPQRPTRDHYLGAGSETIRKIGEEFHAQRALEAVDLEHAPDP